MSSEIVSSSDNLNLQMMQTISKNEQTLEDIKNLTSSKVTDQFKVFLVSQARNELSRVVKLTKFLDRLEAQYISKVTSSMESDKLTLKQYSDCIGLITELLSRSNEIIYKVLRDENLMTILNTTIYANSSEGLQVSSVVTSLKDPQSRERVRGVIQNVLVSVDSYVQSNSVDEIKEVNVSGEVIESTDIPSGTSN